MLTGGNVKYSNVVNRLATLALAAALILGSASLSGCTKHVEPGYVGVEVDSCNNMVKSTPLPVGWHASGACTSIIEYPIYQQIATWSQNPHEGSPHDESLTVQTHDSMDVNVDVSLSYSLDPDHVPAIYQRFHTSNLEQIGDTFLRSAVRLDMQKVAAQYDAQDFISTKKEAARAEVEKLLRDNLSKDGFNIVQLSFNTVRVPDTLKHSIDAKVAMAQKTAEMQAGIARTRAEGEQHVTATAAAAQQLTLSSKAQAEANERIARSLTPQLLQFLMIQKWDGKLPTTTCSAGQGNPFQLVLK
jgi:hypothetical protein